MSVVIAAFAEISFAPLRKAFSKWPSASVDPILIPNDLQLSEDETNSMSSEEDAKQQKKENKVGSCLTLEHMKGRPDMEALFKSEGGSEDSGFFLCGPTAFLGSVKYAIQNVYISQHSTYAIYEESFEL